MKKKILVLAYAISPTRGSEYSVAWNYVINMSKDNELVVLYGTSDSHIGDFIELKKYLERFAVANVRFVEIYPTKVGNILNILNKRNVFVYSFYFAYNLWHRQAYRIAKDLVANEDFDLIHYLVPIGYREPGYLWKLNLPYIWGPIGGTKNLSIKLLKALPLSGKLKLGFRAIINTLQIRINSRLKRAVNRANILMTATTTDQKKFRKIYGVESYYLPENGIENIIYSERIDKKSYDIIKLIWIGRIDENKALIILLEALKKMSFRNQLELHIVGDGILKDSLTSFSEKNQLEKTIVWHGAINRTEVFKLLSQSHLHIITSLTEANTTVIWEAMSAGVPTISLDHCGMHDTICEKCGVKINIDSYEQVISDLAYQLDRLTTSPTEIEKLSNGVIECAKKYTWVERRKFFNKMYDLAIENWSNKTIDNNAHN
jgi:glycosyltransferase involved in cell wall biosynthesis